MPSFENLPTKGVYTLIVFLNKDTRLKVQKLGCFNIPRGYYAYTGSALGNGATSLRKRVARHLKKRKTKHWHIDYLLASENATVVAVVAAESSRNKECQLNNAAKRLDGVMVPIVGFGAADCKHNCKSHLLYYGDENIKEKIVEAYTNLFGAGAVSFFETFDQFKEMKANCR